MKDIASNTTSIYTQHNASELPHSMWPKLIRLPHKAFIPDNFYKILF
jgi:hypothetical protein